jgi:hypothetical protein
MATPPPKAEVCAAEGFWPDVISTDLHTGGAEGPTYDLPTTMTRFLHLGMSLSQVVAASTAAPAAAIGWADRIGSLGVGRAADITVLHLEEYTRSSRAAAGNTTGDAGGSGRAGEHSETGGPAAVAAVAGSGSGGGGGVVGGGLELEDCQGQLRRLSRRLRAVACWKDGRPCRITAPREFPNAASKSSADPSKLLVSDAVVRRILARKQPPPAGPGGKCC